MSPSVTETIKFYEGLCKVCLWGLFSSEKLEISKFHYNFVKCPQVLQRQQSFYEGLCKVCSWEFSSSEKSEFSKFIAIFPSVTEIVKFSEGLCRVCLQGFFL